MNIPRRCNFPAADVENCTCKIVYLKDLVRRGGHENRWREKHVRAWKWGRGEGLAQCLHVALGRVLAGCCCGGNENDDTKEDEKVKVPFLCRRAAPCQGQGDIQYHREYAARKCTRHMSVAYDSIKEG